MNYCCAQCISDSWLTNQLIPSMSEQNGACDYCGGKDKQLIEPKTLSDYFEILISIYKRSKNGRTLTELLKEDWEMFPDLDNAHTSILLGNILDDGQIVRERFLPADNYSNSRLEQWENFKNELMFGNRFFPENEIEHNILLELLPQLVIQSNDLVELWYRARINRENKKFNESDMGAPPKKSAGPGRANPAGIPYLYLASDRSTAVSEIRPHTGEIVSVADYSLASNLQLVDLCKPKQTISPFILENEFQIASLRGEIGFLVKLGEELTKPVLPHEVAINYVPTQYLCEFIKKHGYDGVIYKSSIGEGENLLLFDSNNAQCGSIKQHSVQKVSVSI